MLSAGLIWAALAAYAVTASESHIYFLDKEPIHPKTKTLSISPNTARLLLAQRLDLSQHHELGDADGSVYDILNQYGRDRQTIFTAREATSHPLLVIESVEYPEDLMSDIRLPSLSIENPPSSAATETLVDDFIDQWHQQQAQQDIKYTSRIQLLTNLIDLKRGSPSYETAISDLKANINNQIQSSISATILITPPSPHTKRSSTYYPLTHNQKRQQPIQEEVLSADQDDSDPSPSSTLSAPASATSSPSETSTPAPLTHGILPLCQKTLEAAISVTNNCSGHGTPFKKSAECFACKCSSTVLTDSEGKIKTVRWGGPACQKKDVSQPFFLIAGVSILLLLVSAWGVGLLVSVGSEDLPSVIGAGVAGPKAQR